MTADRPSLCVVPRRGISVLCSVVGGELTEVGPVPLPPGGRCVVSPDGWVACAVEEGTRIALCHADAEPHEQAFVPLPLPEDYRVDGLCFKGDILYVGGHCGSEIAGFFDLRAEAPAWQPLEVPERFRTQGKAIDDLVVDGDRLIAVDDIVYPKFLILYDISEPSRPRLADVKQIPEHGTYERITRGALGESWLALLSGTVGSGGSFQHVALLGRADLQEYGSLHSAGADPLFVPQARELPTWHDVALEGDVLLVAAGDRGVGVLDLGALGRPRVAVSGWGLPDRETVRFNQACLEGLRYVALPPGAQGEAVGVQPVGPGKALAITATADRVFDSVMVAFG